MLGLKLVVLQRAWQDKRATIGALTIVGTTHDPIFTLENPDRGSAEDSRIPAGKYICAPYSGTKFKNVYIINDVPCRSAILIHSGNSEKDTRGCVLLGSGATMMWRDPAVTSSKDAFQRFAGLIGEQQFQLIIKPLILI